MTKPPLRRPSNWWVSRRKALALPSKWVMSSQNSLLTMRRKSLPGPSVKKVWMAFSPE